MFSEELYSGLNADEKLLLANAQEWTSWDYEDYNQQMVLNTLTIMRDDYANMFDSNDDYCPNLPTIKSLAVKIHKECIDTVNWLLQEAAA